MTIHLRPASQADLSTIVDISTAAFPPHKDAIVRHLFPGELHYSDGVREARIARKQVKFGLKNTIMMVAVDGDDDDDHENHRMVGYAVWDVPLAAEDNDADKKESEEGMRLPPLAQEGMDKAPFMELRRLLEEDLQERFGDKSAGDVWTLESLGVHPDHRRKGIGRALLDWGIKEASRQGRECYLVATPAGLPLYRAAGFEDVRTFDIFGTPHVSMRKRS